MFPFGKRRTHEQAWRAWPTAIALGSRRALLLSPRQFDREVARERIRATRRPLPFCVLTVELIAPVKRRSQVRNLVDILHHNLRVTDEKGILSAACYSVLLVDTPEMGGRATLDRLDQLFTAAGLSVQLSLQVHDSEGFGEGGAEPSGTTEDARSRWDESQNRWDDAHDQENWPRRSATQGEVTLAVRGKSRLLTAARDTLPVHVPGEPAGLWPPTQAEKFAASLAPRTPQRIGEVPCRVTRVCTDSARFIPFGFRFAKRTVDILGAAFGLVLFSPFLLAAIAAIKWHDRGPAFFCQTREGHLGQPFTIYKLRTMIVDAEKSQAALREVSHRDGPAFKISHDPRVTQVGQFLRVTCLDELPQLFNVLKGEMSLVGPRPLPWHESCACARWHRRRLDIRPGLTCNWQVNKAKAKTFDEWMRMDLRYLDQWGLLKDLQLIARTLVVPVTGRGGE